jgi:hypothetical protein
MLVQWFRGCVVCWEVKGPIAWWIIKGPRVAIVMLHHHHENMGPVFHINLWDILMAQSNRHVLPGGGGDGREMPCSRSCLA